VSSTGADPPDPYEAALLVLVGNQAFTAGMFGYHRLGRDALVASRRGLTLRPSRPPSGRYAYVS